MKFFKYDRSIGEIMLDDETVFLIKEIGQLLEVKRNITKEDPSGLSKIKSFSSLIIFLILPFDIANNKEMLHKKTQDITAFAGMSCSTHVSLLYCFLFYFHVHFICLSCCTKFYCDRCFSFLQAFDRSF